MSVLHVGEIRATSHYLVHTVTQDCIFTEAFVHRGFSGLVPFKPPPTHIREPKGVYHVCIFFLSIIYKLLTCCFSSKSAFSIASSGGVSMKGNRLTSFTPSELMSSSREANGTRDTSGVLKDSISEYCLSEYMR